MALNNVADEGRLTISMGARQVELATAVDCAIAVVVGLAFENPSVCHRRLAPLRRVHWHRPTRPPRRAARVEPRRLFALARLPSPPSGGPVAADVTEMPSKRAPIGR